MGMRSTHRWNVSLSEARQIQKQLSSEVIIEDCLNTVRYIAGVDVGFKNEQTTTYAAVTILTFPQLQICEYRHAATPTIFPYIPGLLSFRELPAILQALQKVKQQPDLILCDGQGIAHPRRLGIASHLGVITGFATIGVAKKRLVGEYTLPGQEKGNWEHLFYHHEIIGAVLRTRTKVKPLFISPGHKISTTTSVDFVLRCCTKYRLPEPTRLAHKIASDNYSP